MDSLPLNRLLSHLASPLHNPHPNLLISRLRNHQANRLHNPHHNLLDSRLRNHQANQLLSLPDNPLVSLHRDLLCSLLGNPLLSHLDNLLSILLALLDNQPAPQQALQLSLLPVGVRLCGISVATAREGYVRINAQAMVLASRTSIATATLALMATLSGLVQTVLYAPAHTTWRGLGL